MIGDKLHFPDKRALTTGKVALPAPEGPSTQHNSDRYLKFKENRRGGGEWFDLRMSASWLLQHDWTVGPKISKVEKCNEHGALKEKQSGLTSPKLASDFAEEEADRQQAESGRGAKNTRPVVMQILPQTSSECLGKNKNNNFKWFYLCWYQTNKNIHLGFVCMNDYTWGFCAFFLF